MVADEPMNGQIAPEIYYSFQEEISKRQNVPERSPWTGITFENQGGCHAYHIGGKN